MLETKKLTTEELAAKLRRSTDTVIRWRRLRIGPSFVRIRGRVLYEEPTVEAWLLREQKTSALRAA